MKVLRTLFWWTIAGLGFALGWLIVQKLAEVVPGLIDKARTALPKKEEKAE